VAQDLMVVAVARKVLEQHQPQELQTRAAVAVGTQQATALPTLVVLAVQVYL
jgi:hypothetical protein